MHRLPGSNPVTGRLVQAHMKGHTLLHPAATPPLLLPLFLIFAPPLQVLPGDSYWEAFDNADENPPANLHPRNLLLNAVQIDHASVNARLVEALLQRGMPLEEVWQQSGETALLMAVAYDDIEVRRCAMSLYCMTYLGSIWQIRCA